MKKLNFKPRAVVFDMDGVIVDSMPYHFISWYEALRPLGIRVNCFEIYAKEGEKWEKTLTEFLARAHIPPSKILLNRVFETRRKIFDKYFKRFIFKDAEAILNCLKDRGYTLALVTGTNSREVAKILPAGMRQVFDVIVAGDKVRRGKPYPDPYLKAAKELKLKPSECVVIENAPYGVKSAKSAGMFCIALTTSLPASYLSEADMIIERLDKITTIIDKACRIKKQQENQ